jgi:hypothetical protein
MDGFHAIRERVGLIVRLVNPVADKKAKSGEATQLADRQCQCVIVGSVTKRAQNEFPGRKNKYNENI